jgi:adenylate cyclase
MAFYSSPVDNEYNAMRALRTAIEMQKSIKRLKQKDPALSDLGLGIGINTGEVVIGNIGSEKIKDYTVIGDTVNMTQKIESQAASGQILIGASTYNIVSDHISIGEMPLMQLKNKKELTKVYELLEIIS